MPRLKPSDQEAANSIVRACISGNMERHHLDEEQLAVKVGVTKRTIQNKRRQPETLTLQELQRMAKALKFTPFQAASMLLGRELSAKEIKEFILM